MNNRCFLTRYINADQFRSYDPTWRN